MNYFAYGSNMSLARIQKRVPSAKFLGTVSLNKHLLRFHKIGKDGSAKCDIVETGLHGDIVIGALFDIEAIEKKSLDKVEGLGYGYEEKIVNLHNNKQERFEALAYYATSIDSSLLPYSWYLNHVLIGAREIAIPQGYLLMLESIDCTDDLDKFRDLKERAIYK